MLMYADKDKVETSTAEDLEMITSLTKTRSVDDDDLDGI
jgi:hypothetical protein